MVTDDLISVAPPGQRRAVPFRNNVRAGVIAAVASIVIAAITWSMLWKFDSSLHVDNTHHIAAITIEAILALATLVVPFYGIRALWNARRGTTYEREGWRREAQIATEDSRDDVWYVVGFGLSALVVAFLAFLFSANGGSVRNILFNWDFIWRGRHALWRGFWLNIRLFVVAEALVLPWALIVAVVRMLPGKACAPIRTLAIVYIDVLRGIPAIITIYLIVFGFSLAKVEPFYQLHGTTRDFWLAVLALVLVYGAYVAEVYRSGLESIHWGQTAAARSLGLSQWQTLRHVVIPQAVRRILPPLMNDFVALQKDTSLVIIVGMADIVLQSTLLKAKFFNLSVMSGAAFFFLIITIPFTRLVDYLIKRDRERTMAG